MIHEIRILDEWRGWENKYNSPYLNTRNGNLMFPTCSTTARAIEMNTVNIAEQIGRASNSQIKAMIVRRLMTIDKAEKESEGADYMNPQKYEGTWRFKMFTSLKAKVEKAESWLYEAAHYVSEDMWDSIVEEYYGEPVCGNAYCHVYLTD